jgi:hypothetical protein
MKLQTMKKLLLIILFFCAVGLSVSAQITIQSIRKAYGEVKEHISRMTPDEEGNIQEPKEFYELNVRLRPMAKSRLREPISPRFSAMRLIASSSVPKR